MAALAPTPGELLWDVGAGCGSISIEWMRSNARCRAMAIEQNASRLLYIADNATTLGTPNLQIIEGKWHERVGGDLTRIAIQRAEPIGKFLGWRGMAGVLLKAPNGGIIVM